MKWDALYSMDLGWIERLVVTHVCSCITNLQILYKLDIDRLTLIQSHQTTPSNQCLS